MELGNPILVDQHVGSEQIGKKEILVNRKANRQPESDLPKLAAPARRALASAGIDRLEQLTKFGETEIAQLHGIGPNALKDLRRALSARGLSFDEEP